MNSTGVAFENVGARSTFPLNKTFEVVFAIPEGILES